MYTWVGDLAGVSQLPVVLALLVAVACLAGAATLAIAALHAIGAKGLLYRNRVLADDWNRRFYPSATLLLLLLALIAAYLLGAYQYYHLAA